MLINYSVKGFKSFNKEVTLSFKGNKKITNKDNVFKVKGDEILKSAIIYGPNNTGKTTLIDSISWFKDIILNGTISNVFTYGFIYNFFDNENKIDYNIEFIENDNKYKYFLSFKFESEDNIRGKAKIVNEILFVNEELIFSRFDKNEDEEMQQAVNLINNYDNRLIISSLPAKYIKYNTDFINFFKNIYILNHDFDYGKLISRIKRLDEKDFRKFKKIIKEADISIKDLKLVEGEKEDDTYSMFSSYMMNEKRVEIPSVIADSDGTKIFMRYIYSIIKALKSGGIIIIDEIDNSLHTILTKVIISMFNNEDNKNIQLLATSHDLLLLDAKYLFRKDQIWFTYKDKEEVYLYSLNEFKANVDDGIRNKTMESYLKGMFGALPHPNIDEILFDEE